MQYNMKYMPPPYPILKSFLQLRVSSTQNFEKTFIFVLRLSR